MGSAFFKFICWLSLIFFMGCADCGYKQRLQGYTSLSAERLSKLYTQMDKIFNQGGGFHISKEEADKLYPEIADLDFKYIDISHRVIVIGGCFDNKLIMKFYGLKQSRDELPKISISWGDHPIKVETLWPN